MISLEVNGLGKTYNRRTIFKGLSFSAKSGQIAGIAGHNGSGKSTLVKCLAGLINPTSGALVWQSDHVQLKHIRAHAGFAAPYVNLYAELSCFENLEFTAKLKSASPDSISGLIERVGLGGHQHHLFGQLSSGQQQRLKLAAAIIGDPSIVLLDEPGTNLDEKGTELVASIAREAKERNALVVIATNDARELGLCDHIVRIEEFKPAKKPSKTTKEHVQR